MLATKRVQLATAAGTSLAPVAATIGSEPGDMGFSKPAGLAISGLVVVAVNGGTAAAGATNGAVDDVN